MAELTSKPSPDGIFGTKAGSKLCKSEHADGSAGISPLCPQCKNKRAWKDGTRTSMFGCKIQRWLCRDCGLKFSDPTDMMRANSVLETVETVETKPLKTADNKVFSAQICVTETKNLAAEQQTEVLRGKQTAKGTIVEFSFWLLKQGYAKATITGRVKLLNRLMRLGADFSDQETIKEIISKQKWSVSRKVNAVDAYDTLLKMQGKS